MLLHCYQSHGDIKVSLFATNQLGSGPTAMITTGTRILILCIIAIHGMYEMYIYMMHTIGIISLYCCAHAYALLGLPGCIEI